MVNDPRFPIVAEMCRRNAKIHSGIQETAHGQSYQGGHRDGVDNTIDEFFNLASPDED